MNARALVFLLLGIGNAFAQGFAGLGRDAEGFAVPEPGKRFVFPQDHGAHPEYRIEWWYLTANLTGPDGADYGLQWTLFRSALAPGEAEGWESPQVWFGHAAVTSSTAHFATERFARGGTGQAGVTAEPFVAWITTGRWRETVSTTCGLQRRARISPTTLRCAPKARSFSTATVATP